MFISDSDIIDSYGTVFICVWSDLCKIKPDFVAKVHLPRVHGQFSVRFINSPIFLLFLFRSPLYWTSKTINCLSKRPLLLAKHGLLTIFALFSSELFFGHKSEQLTRRDVFKL